MTPATASALATVLKVSMQTQMGDGDATRAFGMIEKNPGGADVGRRNEKKNCSATWSHSLAAHIVPIHTGLAIQARSAGDNSVNNPVCWGRLVFAPGGFSQSHIRHSPAQPTFLVLRAPPVYCKPLQSLWLAWIVHNTSATLIADDALPLSVPAQLGALGRLALLA